MIKDRSCYGCTVDKKCFYLSQKGSNHNGKCVCSNCIVKATCHRECDKFGDQFPKKEEKNPWLTL